MRNVCFSVLFSWYGTVGILCELKMTEDMAAELSTDATALVDNQDSRKRPLDEDNENGVSKKSHFAGDVACNLKILVPSAVVGGIIGKGGERLAQLQKDVGVRVKMSKANDFYPGTTDRVCLITGVVDSIVETFTFILHKIVEKLEMPSKSQTDSEKPAYELGKQSIIQIKMLVPNSTAGMIIGKGGSFIQQIKEESGAHVQITRKAKDKSLIERCVTVTGDMRTIIDASRLILSKVVEDPLSNSCLNISYSDVIGPVANSNPSGSPYAVTNRQQTTVLPVCNSLSNNLSSSLGAMFSNDGNLNLSLNLGTPFRGSSITAQLLEQIKYTLRGSGYNEQATGDIIAAMITLAKYGILGMGLAVARGSGSTSLNNSSILSAGNYLDTDLIESNYSKSNNNVQYGNDFYGVTNSNVPRIEVTNSNSGFGSSDQYEGRRPPRKTQSSPGEEPEPGKSVSIEIPENIIGAILGPGGRSLIDIQNKSGANIQISKKGSFAPGTRNRLVSISGPPNSVNAAQFLIKKRVEEEERKRARAQTNIQLN